MIPIGISKHRYEELCENSDDVHEKILQMILNEKWRDVIEHLTHDMDPWDIDLTLLNERFLRCLEELRCRDLKIPAKMILIAALIYRMKSEFFKEDHESQASEDDGEHIEINSEMLNQLLNEGNENVRIINLPPIFLPIKKPIKRKVTLHELIDALEKALKSRRKAIRDEEFIFEMNKFDIREMIEKTYEKIIKMFNVNHVAIFSKLLEKRDAYDKIITLEAVLHLNNEERIRCVQERPFDEIKIYPFKEEDG